MGGISPPGEGIPLYVPSWPRKTGGIAMIGPGSDKKEDKEEYSPASRLPRPSVHLAGKAALGGEELWLVLVVVFF